MMTLYNIAYRVKLMTKGGGGSKFPEKLVTSLMHIIYLHTFIMESAIPRAIKEESSVMSIEQTEEHEFKTV